MSDGWGDDAAVTSPGGDEAREECPQGGGGDGCRKCGEEGHFVKDCPQRAPGDNKCRNCREEGHIASECPEPQRCRRCKSEDHMMADCPEPAKCGNCRQEGHMTSECTEPEVCRRCRKEGHKAAECDQPMRCHRCGETGHMGKDCEEGLKTHTFTDAEGNEKEIYVPRENENAEELYKMGVQSGINFSKYSSIPVKVTGENAPDTNVKTFEGMGLRELVLNNIKKSDYKVPTPVQVGAIPIIKAKRDLMACAQTGSGKSAAFLVPIVDRLLEENVGSNASEDRTPVKPEAVIVTPTRELARQIHRQAKKFAQGSVLRAVVAYGETSVIHQIEEIRKGCNILVATPGRLLHFAEGSVISFSGVKVLVLDEADRMLDEGFMESVQKTVTAADMAPAGSRQTLMFSATFSDAVQETAQEFLDTSYLFLTVGTVGVGMVGGICGDISIEFHEVDASDKREKLDSLLGEVDKDKIEKTIIFVGKKTSADYLSAYLSGENLLTTSIHGDRTQRQREEALADFTEGRFRILVATAVAARGLDIPQVQHVINYDLPDTADEFIHRIGRTARVGNLGRATSFFCSETDFKIAPGLVKVLSTAGKEVPDYIVTAAESEGGDGGAQGGSGAGGGGDDDEWA